MSDIRNWKKIVENATKVVANAAEDVNHTDHEVSMAKSQLYSSVKSSVRIAKHLKDLSEEEGLEGWVASKLTLAEEYLQTVADYMDGEKVQEGYKVLPKIDKEKYQSRDGLEGPFSTLSGKVVYYDPKEGKYYDPDTDMYMSYEEFQNYDNDYSNMKTEDVDGHNLELLKKVATQIMQDVKMGDYTAIDELLKHIPEEKLKGFLSQTEEVEQVDEGYEGAIKFVSDGNVQMHLAEKDLGVAAKNKQFLNPVEKGHIAFRTDNIEYCLLYTSPRQRDRG